MLNSKQVESAPAQLQVDQLLADLVAIPSLSGEEAKLADWLTHFLREAGLAAELVGRNVVVELRGKPGPVLLMVSHLDTVPAGEGWQVPVHAARWQGAGKASRLIGLGANDAKASVAAMCCALLNLDPGKLNGVLRVAFVVEEETSNAGMGELVATYGMPDLAIVGEPTGLEVVHAQAGLAILRATWTGSSCHSAHAANLKHENALLKACRELAGLPDCHSMQSAQGGAGPSTVVPAVLHSGDRHNRVPDLATCTFDVRLAPGHCAEDAAQWLRDMLPSAELEVISDRLVAMHTAEQHELVQAALLVSGQSRAIASKTMSDMALLPGVPAIKVGPGQSSRSHSANEFITRAELESGVEFYTRLVQGLLYSRNKPSTP